LIDLRQKELSDWEEKNFPRNRYENMSKDELINTVLILQTALGVVEEAGEIAHHVLKGSQGIRGGVDGYDKDEITDGVGDVNIYSTQLLSKFNIDAEAGITETIDSVLNRNWQEHPTGKDF